MLQHCGLFSESDTLPQDDELIADRSASGLVTRLAVSAKRCVDRQVRLTEWVSRAVAQLEGIESKEPAVFDRVERLLGRTVDIVSRGPCATDVMFRKTCFEEAQASTI